MILQTNDIQRAADLIKKGGLVAFPTETVYGLGASIFNKKAIQEIFVVKRRPQDNPLIAHIAHLDQLSHIVYPPPADFYRLAEAFFPGPLTILLEKREEVPSIVTADLPFLGVRMPAHPIAQALIMAVGVPLVAPSANLSGRPSSTTALHVLHDFGESIGVILDGGACQIGLESTVMTLNPNATILRPGAITQEEIESVLNRKVEYANETMEKPLSPGMKYRHYAPDAKVLLFESQIAFDQYLARAPDKKRLVLRAIQPKELYAFFRQADTNHVEEIVILCDSLTQRNRALMNRLIRASHQ